MLGEAPLAVNLAERMQAQGVYVVAFAFPVVPHGKARIRTQMSAAHTREQLDRVIAGVRPARDAISASFTREHVMKALVKARAEPGIWLQDVPEPSVGHNDVLIKVHRTAICGTDMHIYNWDAWAQKTVPVPMAVGHEYSGEIVELGSEVRGFNTGDRVSGEGHITCGHCRNCRAGRRHLCRNTSGVGVNRAGAFAEYLTIPASNVFKLPAAIDDEIASILDPFGNATHTALAFNVVGEDVLITGAGPIGIMAVAIARHCGARHIVITDVNDYRLGLAAKMGASKALNVSRESLDDAMRELGMEEGFDVGFEMSGNADGAARNAAHHEPRRQHLHARHSARRNRHRLEPGHFQGPGDQGHLRPRDVRNLVQDVEHAAERPRRAAGDHASLGDQRLPRRLRDHEFRQIRQDHPGLVQPVGATGRIRGTRAVDSSDMRGCAAHQQ